MNKDKKKIQGLPAFLSVMVFVIVAALLFFIYRGDITVMAECRAEKGAFNRNNEDEMVSELISDRSGYLRIPLPDTVEESDITVSDEPFKKLIFVRISGVDEDYYKDNFFSGDMTGIKDVRYGYLDGISTVELETEKLRVPVSEYVRGGFFIKVVSPAEVYGRVVVIDPGHGGDDPGSVVYGIEEKKITENVALRIKDKLVSQGAGVYLISRDDPRFTDEYIAGLADEIDADILLTLHTGADANTRTTKGVSVKANSGIKDKAEILTQMLSEACGQKNLGLSNERLSGVAEITASPCIWLKLGVITNKEEALKMDSEEYQEKAADTIVKFINTELRRGENE